MQGLGYFKTNTHLSIIFQNLEVESTFRITNIQTLFLASTFEYLLQNKIFPGQERSPILMVEFAECSSFYSAVAGNIPDNELFYMTSRIDFCWARLGAWGPVGPYKPMDSWVSSSPSET